MFNVHGFTLISYFPSVKKKLHKPLIIFTRVHKYLLTDWRKCAFIRGMDMINGKLLKEQREKAGLTRAELARLAKVSRPTIYKAENGEDLLLSTVDKLAKVLGLPTHALILSKNNNCLKTEG